MAKVRVFINKSKIDSQGLCPLKIRVSHEGTRKEKYLPGIKINPKYWNAKKQTVTNDKLLSLRIENELTKFRTAINKSYLMEEPIRPNRFFEKMDSRPKKISSPTLVQYCRSHFAEDLTLRYGTRKNFNSFANIIGKYDPNVKLNELSMDWVAKFKEHLIVNMKVNNYTVQTRFKTLRRIVRHAVENKVLALYPLTGMKIQQVKANRTFLTIDQIKQLMDYCEKKEASTTLKAFLFSCFTGLRFGDLTTIQMKDIITENSVYYLKFTMRKTQKYLKIALGTNAMKYIDMNKKDSDQPVFDFLSKADFSKSTDMISKKIESVNAKANCHLKTICKEAGIDKSVSYHISRHSFACAALQLGTDLMTLRDNIGHGDLKQTQEYLHVMDSNKKDAMLKFDKI
ncbi:MAG: site-specific integrase [Saprospiraceae bacterium]|nr:site-specific integrase [Saprospiraceae bacterium]